MVSLTRSPNATGEPCDGCGAVPPTLSAIGAEASGGYEIGLRLCDACMTQLRGLLDASELTTASDALGERTEPAHGSTSGYEQDARHVSLGDMATAGLEVTALSDGSFNLMCDECGARYAHGDEFVQARWTSGANSVHLHRECLELRERDGRDPVSGVAGGV